MADHRNSNITKLYCSSCKRQMKGEAAFGSKVLCKKCERKTFGTKGEV